MTVALGGRHYYCQDSCYPDEGVRQWLGWWPKVMKLINGIWTLSIKFQILKSYQPSGGAYHCRMYSPAMGCIVRHTFWGLQSDLLKKFRSILYFMISYLGNGFLSSVLFSINFEV